MKLLYSPASPFVRKCLVLAHETGLNDQIELMNAVAHPVNRNEDIYAHAPLGKVPALILDDGHVLFDSRVICEYLDGLHEGEKMIPAITADEPMLRYNVLVMQALGDGIMDAAVSARFEISTRPEEKQWDGWVDAQLSKVASALDSLETWRAGRLQDIHLGSISVACALSYLDFRHSGFDWRKGRPVLTQMLATFAERTSMKQTEAKG